MWGLRAASGRFATAEDLAGVTVAGSPAEVAAQCVALHRAGVDHLIHTGRFRVGGPGPV